MRLAFVTNNASRTPAAIAAQLAGFGVPAAAADVVTSAQAAATLLASGWRPARPSWWSAAPRCASPCASGGCARSARRWTGPPPSCRATRPVSATRSWPKAAWPSGPAPGSSPPTRTPPCRPPRGIQPGNGSLCQVIAHATGQQPVVAGKPEPPLHAEAVARTGAQRPLVVGDRLDTDIEGAVRAAPTACWC